MIDPEIFSEMTSKAVNAVWSEPRSECAAPYECEYESDLVTLKFVYDSHRSNELTVTLRQRNHSGGDLSLSDVLAASECPVELVNRYSLMQTGDPVVLARLINGACQLLGQFAGPFLKGDSEAFEFARRERAKRAELYTRRVSQGRRLLKAEEAWSQKDFDSVIEHLAPIEELLDEHWRRRLAYSLGRVN